MNEQLKLRFATLAGARQFDALLELWHQNTRLVESDEPTSRLVAGALAESGLLNEALEIVLPWAERADVPQASCALAARLSSDTGNHAQALRFWERAINGRSHPVSWWMWFAEASLVAQQPERALIHAEAHRLRFDDDATAAYLWVRLLASAARIDEALIEFERLLGRWPNHPVIGPAFANFVVFEFPEQALDCLRRTQWRPHDRVLSPDRVRACLEIVPFCGSPESEGLWRARFIQELQLLTEIAGSSDLKGDARARCLSVPNFFCAFTEENITAQQFAWGEFIEALVKPLRDELPAIVKPAPHSIRRVGFVSNRVNFSSAGRVFNRWIDDAVTAGFDVRVFAVGDFDEVTAAYSKKVTLQHFANDSPDSWLELCNAALNAECDLVIYPEPQGSPLLQIVAGIKLAPLQAAGFGNPLTTGLRSVDFFLSPVEAEAPDGQAHYREKLVRLAATWQDLAASLPSDFGREAFGFREDERVYLVTQPMHKWTFQFRQTVIDILRRDPLSRLAFVRWSLAFSFRAFEVMLRREFHEAGLVYGDRVRVCGHLATKDYLALLRSADVVLDTFGFAGGSSTFDAVSVGVPAITLRGRFLRGRQSAALIDSAGLGENVTDSPKAFADRAITVATARSTQRFPRDIAEAGSIHVARTSAPPTDIGVNAPTFLQWLVNLRAG